MTFYAKMDDKKININLSKTAIGDVLQYCKPKEQLVLVRKFGILDKKWIPLQRIGRDYNLTRERVRQIESQALMRFRRLMINNARYIDFIESAKKVLDSFGWLMPQEDLVNEMANKKESDFSLEEMRLILISDFDITYIKRNKFLDKCFYLDNLFEDLLTNIAIYIKDFFTKSWKSENLYDFLDIVKNEFVKKYPEIEYLKNELFYMNFLKVVRWVMVFDNRVWLDTFQDVNLKTIKLKMLYTMRKIAKPLHYLDFPEKILSFFPEKKSVNMNTIHNELVKNNDIFINTWLGMYWLTERWFKWWTVLSIVFRIIKKSERPISIKEIAREVLKEKMVSPNTITLTLQKYKQIFERVDKWVYKLTKKAHSLTEEDIKEMK